MTLPAGAPRVLAEAVGATVAMALLDDDISSLLLAKDGPRERRNTGLAKAHPSAGGCTGRMYAVPTIRAAPAEIAVSFCCHGSFTILGARGQFQNNACETTGGFPGCAPGQCTIDQSVPGVADVFITS